MQHVHWKHDFHSVKGLIACPMLSCFESCPIVGPSIAYTLALAKEDATLGWACFSLIAHLCVGCARFVHGLCAASVRCVCVCVCVRFVCCFSPFVYCVCKHRSYGQSPRGLEIVNASRSRQGQTSVYDQHEIERIRLGM